MKGLPAHAEQEGDFADSAAAHRRQNIAGKQHARMRRRAGNRATIGPCA
ncbi:MAG TPA: hypothetical protein VKS22_13225 [Candidatus Binataceae bacterium]|nr:hypothetical protein [Candidatus Binataceae bacterium]